MKLFELPFSIVRANLADCAVSITVWGHLRAGQLALQHGESQRVERVDGCDLVASECSLHSGVPAVPV